MEVFEYLARWGHYVFGITWIGLLYYFNFVQAPAQAAASAVGACQYRDLPDDEADWATTLIEFFGQ